MKYPRLQRPGPVYLDLMYPVGRWREGKVTIGGFSEAESGARESYIIRRDRVLELPIAYPESKHEEMLAFLEYFEDHPGETFTFYPDALNAAVSFVCVLVRPAPGERWFPEHHQHSGVFTTTLEMRRADGLPFTLLRF